MADLNLPLISVTLLDAHIAALLEKETDLITRGKANAAGYRATRLQLEAVKDDILGHDIMVDEDKRIAHFDEILARLLCHKDGMDPDFVGTGGKPNWVMFTQEQRMLTWKSVGASEEFAAWKRGT
jgi:hypothetical protein